MFFEEFFYFSEQEYKVQIKIQTEKQHKYTKNNFNISALVIGDPDVSYGKAAGSGCAEGMA